MKRVLLLFAAILVAGCIGPTERAQPAVDGDSSAAAAIEPTATPEVARDFTFETLDGGSVTLSDLRGEWVLVNFWATWCPPCVEEMAYFEDLHNTRDINVLGINFAEATDVVQSFVDKHGITFPILLEPDDITVLFYGARALPRTVVVAPDGTIAGRTFGEIRPEAFDDWLDAQEVPFR